LLKRIARKLGFPAYFGMNWDALNDCLTDMSWRPAAGYVLLFKNWGAFARNDPGSGETARHIFEEAAKYWQEKSVPFYVILSEAA
jgi:RNAse (barnase) inhibitor barstar